MPQAGRVIGIPGAGKTHRALELVEKNMKFYPIHRIGFSTFTRAARREAAQRAASQFGLQGGAAELEKDGYFRTVHSVAFKHLGCTRDALLAGKEGGKWISNELRDTVEMNINSDGDDWSEGFGSSGSDRERTPTEIALSMWEVARNCMTSAHAIYQRAAVLGGLHVAKVDLATVLNVIGRYEEAKKRAGRYDFTDLLLEYSGWQATVNGVNKVTPSGDVPNVPVWLLDELQDSTKLQFEVMQRLTADAKYVYLFGDANQEIYTWSGANSENFLNWPVAKQEYLSKSWRCPSNILKFGTTLLSRCSAPCFPPDLVLEPREEGGIVRRIEEGRWLERVDRKTDTLIMARTNRELKEVVEKQLTERSIPWKHVKVNRGWPKPTLYEATLAFRSLARGDVIEGNEWVNILKVMKNEVYNKLFARGTKQRFTKPEELERSFVHVNTLPEHGALEPLCRAVREGTWPAYLEEGDKMAKAAELQGDAPMVRVATVHGAKGLQAKRVFLHTALPRATQVAIQSASGRDEELRVWYVGATRASEELIIVRPARPNAVDRLFEVLR